MGFGLPLDVAALWDGYQNDENFLEQDDEYAWFVELPDWAYDQNEGPFYIDPETGAIWGLNENLSIDTEMFRYLGQMAD